jgi:MFS family permease
MITSAASARLAPRLGRNILSLGAGVLCIGVLLTIGTIRLAGVDLKGYELIPAFFVGGMGLGFIVAPLLNVVLHGVPVRSAGSASGVFTTVQQVGVALGIALIGVIFFGQIASNADSAIARVLPNMNSQLIAAGLPSSAIAQIDRGVTICFHDIASASDPTVFPASCKRATNERFPLPRRVAEVVGPRIGPIVQKTLRQDAVKQDFTDSIQVGLLFNLGAWGLAFFLVPLLPKVSTLSHAAPAAG